MSLIMQVQSCGGSSDPCICRCNRVGGLQTHVSAERSCYENTMSRGRALIHLGKPVCAALTLSPCLYVRDDLSLKQDALAEMLLVGKANNITTPPKSSFSALAADQG